MKLLKKILLAVLIAAAPALLPAQTIESYTFTTNRLVPDGNFSGLSDVRTLNSAIGNISSLKVRLTVAGEFNGDLYVYLRHTNGFTVLLNRVGKTAASPYGYGDSGFNVTFQTGASNGDVHLYQNVQTPAAGSPLTGTWQPDGRNVDPTNVTDLSTRSTSLTNFAGLSAAGAWTLYVADVSSGGTNMITQWGLDISGAAIPTIAWTNPADITYGAALGATQFNATASYNSTNVAGTFTYALTSGTVLNAGSNQVLTAIFTPTDTNAFLPITNSVAINVQPASLMITANSTNKVYGAALPGLTASYSGFVNGDAAASLTTQATLATSATGTSPTGVYAVSVSGAASTNYNITQTGGTLTVTPASLLITANPATKVYGAALPVLTAAYNGFVNGDGVINLTTPVTLATAATTASNVGSYGITASGAAYTNYNVSFVSGSLAVTAATLTVSADNKSMNYGATVPVLTATYGGFVLSQGTNVLSSLATLATTATSSSAPGSYPITASAASAGNYTFSYVSGSLTVGQSATAGAIVSSLNPAVPGTNVTFTMTVSAAASGTPSGTVNFRIDGSVAGSGTLAGGVATYSTSSLLRGTHTVTGEYAGDTNFTGTTNALAQSQIIDTPPVAGNLTISRTLLSGVKVRLATLLTNATDADGVALSISVSSTSASNATIVVQGGWVYYTPPAGFTNGDSFTYTVNDGLGGAATGTVTVTVPVDNTQSQNLSIVSLGAGSYQIYGSGIPNYTYRLQYSDVIPFVWQSFSGGSLTADSTGRFQYTDTSGSSARYYRTVYP